MKKIRFKAIILGVLTDIGGSLLASLIFGVVMGATLVAAGLSPKDIASHLHGPIVLVPGLIIGFGFTILGGFVAGRVARQAEVLHGGLIGAIDIPVGLLLWSSSPLWFNILSLIGSIPLGMIGGFLAKRARRKYEISKPALQRPPPLPSENPSSSTAQ